MDTGRKLLEQAREALTLIDQTLTIPAAEYVPAISDVFIIIDKARAAIDHHLRLESEALPPYSAPFTTDVPQCCGNPLTCSDPCMPERVVNEVIAAIDHHLKGEPEALQAAAQPVANITFTPEQVSALYLFLSKGRTFPEKPEKRPAFGWMEPALIEAEKLLKPWHSHFHDRRFNAMNRQFFGDGRFDFPVSAAPAATPPKGESTTPAEPGDDWRDAKIAALEAELAPHREREAEAARIAKRQERVEQIVSRLFPTFDAIASRRDASKKPLQWHEKSWWWNGASITWADSYENAEGGFTVSLESYVGRGDYESGVELHLPSDWLVAEDWETLVDSYKQEQFYRCEKARVAEEAAEAERKLLEAQATLQRLKSATPPASQAKDSKQ